MTEAAKTPVVFVHGLWMHASSWGPWLDLFGERGYSPVAPGWPGDSDTVEATRANPGALNNRGIAEITDHFAQIIGALPAKPILIGHSFGGLIVERLLGQGYGRGAVAISPAQFKGILGLPLPQLESAFPILSHPGLRKKTWSHTRDSYAKSFANGVSRTESDEIFDRFTIPGPARVLFQAATANFNPKTEASVDTHSSRGPLLITGASLDRTVPPATARGAYKIQRKNSGVTEFKLFQGKSHSYPADSGWREVADAALDFLTRYGLGPTATPGTA